MGLFDAKPKNYSFLKLQLYTRKEHFALKHHWKYNNNQFIIKQVELNQF